jgi:uncharacterized protein YggE
MKPDQILPDSPAPSNDMFPTHAATPHDARSEAIADALISARAVIADLTHHPDTQVIAAARVIAEHSPMPTERGEAEELIFWMEGPKQ